VIFHEGSRSHNNIRIVFNVWQKTGNIRYASKKKYLTTLISSHLMHFRFNHVKSCFSFCHCICLSQFHKCPGSFNSSSLSIHTSYESAQRQTAQSMAGWKMLSSSCTTRWLLPQTQLHLDTSVLQVAICGTASPKAMGPILRAAAQA